jgi:hypothetical protein
MEKHMVARQVREDADTKTSRRQVLAGTGSLALAIIGSLPWASARAAQGYGATSFEPYVGQGFLVIANQGNTALRLVRVVTYPRGNRPASLPDPFSLIFRDYGGSEPLPAQLVEIEHAGVGRLTVYLNPITNDPSYYEVAFN